MGINQTSLRGSLAGFAAAALRASVWLGAFGFGAAVAAVTSIDVPTIVVQAGAARAGFVLDGTIQPVRQATVAAQVGGNVVALTIKAGDRVKAGQVIARIDERDAQAGVLRSDAALAQADAEARNARMNAERTRDLRTQGFISQAALDTAETQLKAAQAGVQQAQAGRSQAALARGYASVNAPFDGVVLATHLDTGDLATPGRPVATVYAPGALRAVVQVAASQADVARAAQRVEIELPNGQWVVPERRAELATTDPVSQTVEWRLDLAAASLAGVMPGQNVRVRFTGATPAAKAGAAAPRVPQAAVLRRGELTAVYVVQGDGFALRAVRLGADHGAEGVDVLAGLKPGDRISADALKAGLATARPAVAASASK
jgi:RND family efflux transporter MFP subunit